METESDKRKHSFFIYDRKEMVVLVFLGIMVAAFAFTLGVHLGKQVAFQAKGGAGDGEKDHAPVNTEPDKVPSRLDLSEQSKGVEKAADDTLNDALHEEVTRTGIRLDPTRQVELPDRPKAKNAGATTLHTALDKKKKMKAKEASKKKAAQKASQGASGGAALAANPLDRSSPGGRYSIQVGSFSSLKEASERSKLLDTMELKPFVRSAQVKGMGKWYRVYLGGYESKKDAQRAGSQYKERNVIESFLVVKMPN